ncbi:MAG TPA: DNA-processing protein DprA [Burkholderiales bacterium]|nr:DNA-processing protein DprA [Burkholderiales bacterium]
MPPDDELAAWLNLSLTPGLSADGMRRLLAAFGDPQQVIHASNRALTRHVEEPVAAAIKRGARGEALTAAYAWLKDPANRVVTLADAEYPRQLLQIADPPPVLYARGRLELLNRPALAIVGSRNATSQGMVNAESFARTLSDAGLTIASGLALGIDAAAHRGGLAGASSSIAVVGTGLDIVYPARNRALAHELGSRGVLLSEFSLGTPAIAGNFPRRNRLISGLSLGCLVVEAAVGSGSLITARAAAEQGREVFAVPGSIHSPLAKGCHALIKQGAKLAESANDVLEELRLAPSTGPAAADAAASPAATTDESSARVVEALGFDPCDLDAIVARCGMSVAQISALLTQLEIDGIVAALPGGKFQRVR